VNKDYRDLYLAKILPELSW